jgi:hypothetical protein
MRWGRWRPTMRSGAIASSVLGIHRPTILARLSSGKRFCSSQKLSGVHFLLVAYNAYHMCTPSAPMGRHHLERDAGKESSRDSHVQVAYPNRF